MSHRYGIPRTVVVLLAAAGLLIASPALALETAEVQASRLTLADMRTTAVLIETALAEGGELPATEDWIRLGELELLRPPRYAERLRLRDAWGKPFLFWCKGDVYLLASNGPDGRLDIELGAESDQPRSFGGLEEFSDDLVLFGTPSEHHTRWGLDPISRFKRTMADMRWLASAIESYAIDNDVYPGPTGGVGSIELVRQDLSPIYIRTVPHLDGWGREFLFWSDGSCYFLVSAGGDGLFDRDYGPGCDDERWAGATTDPAADIVFANGQFVQWPEATQH